MNYKKLPRHIRAQVINYVENHELPEEFLQAVISDKLSASFDRSNGTNIIELCSIVSFLSWEVPSACWGSEEKMMEWIKLK